MLTVTKRDTHNHTGTPKEHNLSVFCHECLQESMKLYHAHSLKTDWNDQKGASDVFTQACSSSPTIAPKSQSRGINELSPAILKKQKLEELSKAALKEINLIVTENELLEGILKHRQHLQQDAQKLIPISPRKESSRSRDKKRTITAVFPISGRPMPWEISKSSEKKESVKKSLIDKLQSSRTIQVMSFRTPCPSSTINDKPSPAPKKKSCDKSKKASASKSKKAANQRVVLSDRDVRRISQSQYLDDGGVEPWRKVGLSSVENHRKLLQDLREESASLKKSKLNMDKSLLQTLKNSLGSTREHRRAKSCTKKAPDTRLDLTKLCKQLKLPANTTLISEQQGNSFSSAEQCRVTPRPEQKATKRRVLASSWSRPTPAPLVAGDLSFAGSLHAAGTLDDPSQPTARHSGGMDSSRGRSATHTIPSSRKPVAAGYLVGPRPEPPHHPCWQHKQGEVARDAQAPQQTPRPVPTPNNNQWYVAPSPLWPLTLSPSPVLSDNNPTNGLLDGGPDETALLCLLSERRRVRMMVARSRVVAQQIGSSADRCLRLVEGEG